MGMLSEIVRASIETKLNANLVALAESATNHVPFTVGQYYKDLSSEKDFIFTIENGYKTIETSYVPVNMVFTAEYKPLKGTRTGSATAHLEMFVCVDDNNATNRIEACNYLSEPDVVIGNSETLADGSTNYNTVWNMSAITDDGHIVAFNGHQYITLSCEVFIEFSDTYFFGNSYSISFDETAVNFISAKNERGCEEDLPQILGEIEQKGGIKTNARTFTLSAYLDDGLSDILDSWESAFDQDEIHQISITTPTSGTAISTSVQVKSYVYNIEKGELVSASIEFVVSDGTYTPVGE